MSAASAQAPVLHVELDVPLPGELATGVGTALFVCGWCHCPGVRISSLSLLVAGQRQELLAHGMPRLDPYRELRDPYAYRSGFWGIARIAPPAPPLPAGVHAELVLELLAQLQDGNSARAELARIRMRRALAAATPERPPGAPTQTVAGASSIAPSGEPLVAICMATHNPPRELLAAQLDSIRAQTHHNWVCCVSDDCSSPASFSMLAAALAGDPRFALSRAPRRLGFYHNFERALAMAPARAQFVALADQDDRWYPDKLTTLLAEIGDAPLIYSDARIVARDGRMLSDTYWSARRNNHTDLRSLLVANCVTGAASLLRRDLLDDALPFPPGQFAHYHDHWLGLVAACLGEIRFTRRPLYDYVQHGDASLGHATANQMRTLGERLRGLRTRSGHERIRKWRMHYFVDLARLLVFATVLQQRCGDRMAPRKRLTLERFLACDRSFAELLTLLWRGVRELTGTSETLGAEWMLFLALLWRRLLSASARELPQRRFRLDALPPSDLASGAARGWAPGADRGWAPGAAPGWAPGSPARAIADKIAPLALDVRADAPARVNLLIPTIDLDHFFGGYIAKFNLALALARRGHRVRIVTVDPLAPLPRGWVRQLESYSGLAGFADRVEVAFARELAGLAVSPADRFIATTWWTAHIAARALQALGAERFLYLIQEYEPFTFAMGTYAALARQSYDFPHQALFSTELLRDYFRARRIGVYAPGVEVGDRASGVFDNAITTVARPTVQELGQRGTRRLLFYARPERHAARNLFELGVLALQRAVADGGFGDGWELHGIGTVQGEAPLALGDGRSLRLLRRATQGDYARVLREHDVGLALMYTPHPSLVPLEMASAGLLAVTNSFENKTAAALRRISSNLLAAEPTIESVAAALARAAAGAGDYAARVAGSDVRWPTSWSAAFDGRVLAFVEAALAPTRAP
ncbi:MAG: glycosyltransferase [Solirubrobacteraceae bacterium]